jgi:uncharacterized membrane protein YgdD (TMEM256/DUF423 family)
MIDVIVRNTFDIHTMHALPILVVKMKSQHQKHHTSPHSPINLLCVSIALFANSPMS